MKKLLFLFSLIIIVAFAGCLYVWNYRYETGYNDGYSAGYQYGYLKGVEDGAGRGYNIRDPTYSEVLQFVAEDQTDKHEYTENYTCLNFAADFKNNAFQAGYRCGFVRIEFPDSSHAIVCFNTTDKGIIFIEPQFDDIVQVIIGFSYSELNGYETPDYNDTIISYTIIW